MTPRTCRHCQQQKQDSPELWHSLNVCHQCWRERSKAKWVLAKARRQTEAADADPLIHPPKVRVIPGSGCEHCKHEFECRELVNRGSQVLCAPVHLSDLWLERAYQVRMQEVFA